MRDFQRNNRRDDSRGGRGRDDRRGGGGDFRRRDFDRPLQMFSAVCDNCGKDCEVPFKPTGEKPVYCRDCFQKMGGGERRDDRRDDRRGGRENFSRRPDFGERRGRDNDRPQQGNNDFSKLNEKLDKIISLLSQNQTPKAEEVKEVVETPVEVVKAVKAKKKKVVKVLEETPKE